MAKKINDTEANPAQTSLEDRHTQLQAERRELEAELLLINSQVREAVMRGDLAALESLSARQSELPKLFIAASVAETAARRDMYNAEDGALVQQLEAAQADREKATAKLAKR